MQLRIEDARGQVKEYPVERIEDGVYRVGPYTVRASMHAPLSCTCKGWQYVGRCKHVTTIIQLLEDGRI